MAGATQLEEGFWLVADADARTWSLRVGREPACTLWCEPLGAEATHEIVEQARIRLHSLHDALLKLPPEIPWRPVAGPAGIQALPRYLYRLERHDARSAGWSVQYRSSTRFFRDPAPGCFFPSLVLALTYLSEVFCGLPARLRKRAHPNRRSPDLGPGVREFRRNTRAGDVLWLEARPVGKETRPFRVRVGLVGQFDAADYQRALVQVRHAREAIVTAALFGHRNAAKRLGVTPDATD